MGDGRGRDAATPPAADHLATYLYDTASNPYGKGQLALVSWGPTAGNQDTFTYDSLGRLASQTRLVEGRSYAMTTLTFDSLNRPLTVQYPNNEVVTVAYDREGENTLAAGSDSLVTGVVYNARSQMTRLERGNGAHTTYGYFGANPGNFRLQTIQAGTAGSLLNLGYTYDVQGNVTSLTEGSDVQNFTYDHRNRLTGVSGAYSHSYTYDKLGNISQWTDNGVVTNYVYGDNAHKQAVTHLNGVQKFWYDANGNMTTRNEAAGNYSQVFDVENRLISVTKTGVGTTTFSYDANGQRVKTVKPDGTIVYTPFPNYEEEVRAYAMTFQPDGAGEDTTVYSGLPTTNYGTDAALSIGETTVLPPPGGGGGDAGGSDAYHHSLLRFDLAAIPSGATVTAATLTLTCALDYGVGPATVLLYPLNATWVESSVTWNSEPGRNSTPTTSVAVNGSTYAAYNLTVTDFVQQWVSGALTNHGFRLEMSGTPTDLKVACRSSDYGTAAERPKLTVTWQDGTPVTTRATYGLAGQTVAVREKGLALAESFDDGNDTGWTAHAGSWSVTAGSAGYTYDQTTTAIGVSNAARPLSQLDAMTFEWTTTWTNDGIAQKGAGLHFFASSGSSGNHGNSYLVYQSNTSLIVYESVSNTLNQLGSATLAAANGETHTYRATYNPTTGGIAAWRDGTFVLTVTDPSPLTSGSYVALRTYNGKVSYDNVRITGVNATFSTLTYLYGDHLGSASVLADTGGALVDKVRFYPFGGYRGSDSSLHTDRGFTGHKQNDELGLIYMNARYYVPSIGRFASADTIVPDPKNPQSYNRYSYVHNRPLNYADPTGHRLCEGSGGECEETGALEAPAGDSLINLEGGGWASGERATVRAAAMQIGGALAAAQNAFMAKLGENQTVTATEAFQNVFGGPVTFNKVNDSCATNCYGEHTGGNTITVYSNANGHIEGNSMWVLHEMGHNFNANALSPVNGAGQPYQDLATNPIVVNGITISPFVGNPRTHDGYRWGENGDGDRTPYVNSWDDVSVGEDYADMFANWVANSFDNNTAGNARYNWMDSRMPVWMALAVANNQ